jgi:hypothetical protein
MRHAVATTAVAVSLCSTPHIAAFQARGGTAPGAKPESACALITPDLAEKYNNKEMLKYLKAEEEPMGTARRCDYGRIGLVVYPPKSGPVRQSPGKEWQPVSGVGQMAFFYSRNNTYAEVMVFTASRAFGIQLGKRTGATMEDTKAEAIALATALVPKLQ